MSESNHEPQEPNDLNAVYEHILVVHGFAGLLALLAIEEDEDLIDAIQVVIARAVRERITDADRAEALNEELNEAIARVQAVYIDLDDIDVLVELGLIEEDEEEIAFYDDDDFDLDDVDATFPFEDDPLMDMLGDGDAR